MIPQSKMKFCAKFNMYTMPRSPLTEENEIYISFNTCDNSYAPIMLVDRFYYNLIKTGLRCLFDGENDGVFYPDHYYDGTTANKIIERYLLDVNRCYATLEFRKDGAERLFIRSAFDSKFCGQNHDYFCETFYSDDYSVVKQNQYDSGVSCKVSHFNKDGSTSRAENLDVPHNNSMIRSMSYNGENGALDRKHAILKDEYVVVYNFNYSLDQLIGKFNLKRADLLKKYGSIYKLFKNTLAFRMRLYSDLVNKYCIFMMPNRYSEALDITAFCSILHNHGTVIMQSDDFDRHIKGFEFATFTDTARNCNK